MTSTHADWRQGALIDLTIDSLSDRGDGVGRWCDRVIFVPDSVPGDRLSARLLHVKPNYAQGKIQTLVQPSPHRISPACIVADKCGGCQWQTVAYGEQLAQKQRIVTETLQRIGGLANPPVDPVIPSPPLGYRNKSTYPLQRSATGQVQAGYYRKGSHKLVNLNQCPVQDERLDPLLAGVKQDIQERGWSIYNEATGTGALRHLSLRVGQRTGEKLLTLVSQTDALEGLEAQAQAWLERYSLAGACMNINQQRSNVIFGPTTLGLAGQTHITERFAGLEFHIRPATFFQINTAQAEAMLTVMLEALKLQGTETIIDAYCGVGTLSLPLAQRSRQVIGVESYAESVAQARHNAGLNGIENVSFYAETVEKWLPAHQPETRPDLVVLDPPRRGCAPAVVEALVRLRSPQVIYISCNPATLARDLRGLCAGGYQVTRVQPLDFFPQTPHVECVAFLAYGH
ncbi:MAG: 23S rRNA (uracil(1939)-C(5))-methyltransferase RlmD [Cyanobacteria bacterium P01_A01_bin.135]